MIKTFTAIRIATTASLFLCCSAALSEAALIRARISDITGKPVQGVKIFLYESSNVRKPADFISEASDAAGKAAVTVPKGMYRAVARLKKGALYGPLMPGDKHSGEPVSIDCSEDGETEADFVVADIREIGQKKRTSNAETIRLSGRILDQEGNPVAQAYAFAHSGKEIEFVPEYLSAWTDHNGNYALYLPATGVFFVGSARQFPPAQKPAGLKEFRPETGKLDVATDLISIVY